MKALFTFIALFPISLFAQEAVEAVNSKVPDSLPTLVLTLVAFIVSDVVMKRWPTANPYSWFFIGKRFANAFEMIFKKLGTMCEQIGNLGQNIKPK